MTPAEKSVKYMKMLCKKYNLPDPVIQYVNRQTCAAGRKNGKPIYLVSEDRLQDETVYGFLEYARVQYVWAHLGLRESKLYMYPNPSKFRWTSNIKGDLAIYCVTIHEMAHIAHHCIDYNSSDRPHGYEYQKWLKKIIRENPYRENFWMPVVESWERFL